MAKRRRKIPRYQREAQARERAQLEALAEVRQAQLEALAESHWDPHSCTREYYLYLMARMPEGAIPANMTRHAPHNSYGPPLCWYQDYKFTCVDCGSHEVWTAAAQQWWYEEAKGPIFSRAIRCRACREARRASHGGTPRRSYAERRRKDDA